MEKTISYLIERAKSAQKASDKLAEKSSKFAHWVRKRMEEIGVRYIVLDDDYTLEARDLNTSVGIYTILDLQHEDGFTDMESGSIGANTGQYANGDFSYWVKNPSFSQVVKFAERAEDILKCLESLVEKAEETTFPETTKPQEETRA